MKMDRFHKAIVMILISTGLSFAQIAGKIIDGSTDSPLAGANVYLSKSNLGTVTDIDGHFYISIHNRDVSKDTLIVSYLGYEVYKIPYSDYPNNRLIRLNPESFTLEQSINIYAERLDLARQEIPHMKIDMSLEEIERYGTSEISDLFKKVPSVRVEGNDLDGRFVQIRGSNASEVNVYFDGILLNNLSFTNAADLSIIPTENIYKLEVLKGANLPLLGSGAFGGVLNILSKKEVETSLMLKTKYGSFENKHYIGSFNVPITENLHINYFGQYNEMKPEIEYFPGEWYGDKTTSSFINSNKQNHILNLDYYFDYGQLRAKFFNYIFKYDKPSWENTRNNYLYALTFNSKDDLNVLISFMDSDDTIDRYIVSTDRYISKYESQNMNIRLSKRYEFTKSSIQMLAEYFHDELNSIYSLKTPDRELDYYKIGLYDNRAALSGIFSFTDAADTTGKLGWETFLGIRGDLSASGYQDLTNTLGAKLHLYKKNWEIRPYINYGKNVKYPTLLESAYSGTIVSFSSTDSTFNKLEPEYNTSYELGTQIRYNLNSFLLPAIDFSFAYFHNTIYNKILKRPAGDYIVQSQIGKNTTTGIEASIRADNFFNRMNLSASYTGLNIDNPLLYEYKPEESYNFQLDYFSRWGIYLTSIYFYEGKSYAWYFDTTNELQSQEIEPHFDIDASLGAKFNLSGINLNIQVSGYNLLDTAGFKYYYLKKRYYQVALSLQY